MRTPTSPDPAPAAAGAGEAFAGETRVSVAVEGDLQEDILAEELQGLSASLARSAAAEFAGEAGVADAGPVADEPAEGETEEAPSS